MEFNISTKTEWVNAEGIYSSGKNLLLGKAKMAYVYYNGGISRDNPNKYSITTAMPGIKSRLGDYATEQEAMVKAEAVLTHWINKFIQNK